MASTTPPASSDGPAGSSTSPPPPSGSAGQPRPTSLSPKPLDFVRQIIADDRAAGRHDGKVVTRFPPEPNGFLHIGHAKSICLNFGLAGENEGACFLRFDDTNPMTEDVKFIESIQEDVKWLGFDWADRLRFASDYYEDISASVDARIAALARHTSQVGTDVEKLSERIRHHAHQTGETAGCEYAEGFKRFQF